MVARHPGRLAAAVEALSAQGGTATAYSADVADAAAVAEAVAAQGALDLVVACAGIVTPKRLDEQPLETFHRTMAVNYLGALHLVHAALPGMRRRGAGRVVLVASGAALIGLYGYTSYAPTKFAVRGLAEALRSELVPEGVAVSVVYPPDTDTPGYREELRQRCAITHRLAASGGLLSADAVAEAIWRGVERDRFVIAPGPSMVALSRLRSLAAPLLHRFWFDPLIARLAPARVRGATLATDCVLFPGSVGNGGREFA